MSTALRGCEAFSVVYIDDILVFSRDESEHLEHLRSVFAALQECSYHVRLEKCSFFAPEVPFLGHVLTADGIKADDNHFDLIRSFQTPFTSVKQVRSFLGMIMWYRTFIPNVATIAAPLFPLTSNKKHIEWNEEMEESVKALKDSLTKTPLLARYDRDLATRVVTDASVVGLGAVLEQLHGEVWRPVAYWSRKLIDAETRYSATDLEWLAVVESVSRVWRHLLEDIPITVRSDHAALARKLSKSVHDPPISPRQARWIEHLMPFHIDFEYVPGKENVVSDALSRYPAPDSSITTASLSLIVPQALGMLTRISIASRDDKKYQELLEKVVARTTENEPDPLRQLFQESPATPSAASQDTQITTTQEPSTDSSTREQRSSVSMTSTSSPENAVETSLCVHSRSERESNLRYDDPSCLSVRDGLLFTLEGQMLLPDNHELKTWAISEAHDSVLAGHFGAAKTLEKLRRRWVWVGIAQDVRDYVSSCPLCQHMKHSNVKPRGLLRPILSQRPWQIVTLDLVGRFAPAADTGYTYCLVIVDKFSKFTILEAVPETISSEMTADIFLSKVVSVFGVPSVVISDRGPQFAAKLWKRLLNKIGATSALSSSHHPQTDGQSERAIQTFLRLLRSFTYEANDQWAEMLPALQFALNDVATEPNGHSPHFIVFGVHPASPTSALLETAPGIPLSGRENDQTPGIPLSERENDQSSSSTAIDAWVKQRTKSFEVVHDFIRKNQQLCAERMKERFDTNRQNLELAPGDLVLVSAKTHPQLRPYVKQQERWYGPYVVKRKVNDNAYAIIGLPPGTSETQNASFLVPFRDTPARFRSRPRTEVAVPQLRDGEWEWEVERISDTKDDRRGTTKFLVHWVGYNRPQWLPLSELGHCRELIQEFYEQNNQHVPDHVQSFLEQPTIPLDSPLAPIIGYSATSAPD